MFVCKFFQTENKAQKSRKQNTCPTAFQHRPLKVLTVVEQQSVLLNVKKDLCVAHSLQDAVLALEKRAVQVHIRGIRRTNDSGTWHKGK